MQNKGNVLLEEVKVAAIILLGILIFLLLLAGLVGILIGAYHLTNLIIDYWWLTVVIGDKGFWVYLSPGYFFASITRPLLWVVLYSVLLGVFISSVFGTLAFIVDKITFAAANSDVT
ncbi:hypothetical protein [Culicoidibacter larvae]|uniref:Uncharacterized protein n=1 Tax=Culicoidibacter larvae TaxID=2579976 RepID=A0A5R8QHR4_9FIRM|nr:hypothetical protein [Culicoidibacter larvae]TLG77334.1 hypothetical protein FEZ08_01570 [Culicoidibacter larvae]